VVELAHHQELALIAAAGIAIAIAYALFDASYLLFTVLLTMFIVLLLVLRPGPKNRQPKGWKNPTGIYKGTILFAYFLRNKRKFTELVRTNTAPHAQRALKEI